VQELTEEKRAERVARHWHPSVTASYEAYKAATTPDPPRRVAVLMVRVVNGRHHPWVEVAFEVGLRFVERAIWGDLYGCRWGLFERSQRRWREIGGETICSPRWLGAFGSVGLGSQVPKLCAYPTI